MSAPRVDLTGQVFGRWIALRPAPSTRPGVTLWLCRCWCGTIRAVRTIHLTGAASRSCGCLAREREQRPRASIEPPLAKPNAPDNSDPKVARAIIEPPLTIVDIGAFPASAFPEQSPANVSDLDVLGGEMTAGGQRELLFTREWHNSQVGCTRRISRPVREEDDTSHARCDGDPWRVTW